MVLWRSNDELRGACSEANLRELWVLVELARRYPWLCCSCAGVFEVRLAVGSASSRAAVSFFYGAEIRDGLTSDFLLKFTHEVCLRKPNPPPP